MKICIINLLNHKIKKLKLYNISIMEGEIKKEFKYEVNL